MRYSANRNDPGYDAWNSLFRGETIVDVFLDGEKQDHCITADSDIGYIRRCKLNADGEIYAEGDSVVEEDIYGNVTFALRQLYDDQQ